ncbi:MAG: hypothetical protein KatS3mg060_3724 [Dehalococcoidia bacterium]|nr:MAG: hypothetical protein KatS3mg060_3724 [Dehalococcoidia bacterium]
MPAAPLDHAPEWLRTGEIVGIGRVPAGSNATFAVAIHDGQEERLAIYKPVRGERRLWDFPDGTLYKREVAAYLTSQALGWEIVPPTIIREGPYGVGSFQVYVEPDERRDYWRIRKRRRTDLLPIALFDIVTNNADRKGEHCHLAADGKIWAIDNGLTFHTDFKNRTVLVDFIGDAIPPHLLEDLEELATDPTRRAQLEECLRELLAPEEIACFFGRVEIVCRTRRMPRVIPHWELYYLAGEE